MPYSETIMGGDGNQEQSDTITKPLVVGESHQGSESLLKRVVKHPLLSTALRILGVSAAVGSPMMTPDLSVTGKALAEEFSVGKQGISSGVQESLPPQRSIEENVAFVKELQNKAKIDQNTITSPEISPSLSVTDTIKLLQVDRTTIEEEWAKEGFNHYEVVDTVYVKKQAGDVSQILTLTRKTDPTSLYGAKIGLVSESHLDPVTNQLTEYKASTFLKLPIQNPGAIAVSADGSFGLVGGEDPIRGNAAKLVAFFDGWKTPKEIEWPKEFGDVGGIIDILPLTGTNSFVINLGNFEGGISMYIADVDPVTKKVKVRATNISGSAHGLSISSVNTTTKELIGVAGGSFTLRGGAVVYRGNYETGVVTADHIAKAKINGQEVNLPYLYGTAIYKDKNGNEYVLASDPDLHYIYNINTKTREATRINYMEWLDGREIDNYLPQPRSLAIAALQPLLDAEGNIHVWFGGGYFSMVDGGGRAVAGHFVLGTDPKQDPRALTLYYLSPNHLSSVNNARDMKIKKIAGQTVLDMNIYNFGKGMVILNPDWSPAQGGVIYYLMKGLGTEAKVNRVYIPVVSKNQSGGW